jgi:predicted RND superfamily exporter protein
MKTFDEGVAVVFTTDPIDAAMREDVRQVDEEIKQNSRVTDVMKQSALSLLKEFAELPSMTAVMTALPHEHGERLAAATLERIMRAFRLGVMVGIEMEKPG